VKRLAVSLIALAAFIVPALAQAGPIAGVVPAHGKTAQPRPATTSPTLTTASCSDCLLYWGGPVMLTNTAYAIYWQPPGYSFDTGYQTTIDGYFANVAAASGSASNVYSPSVQYYQQTGSTKSFITYNSTFGGSWTDTRSFPADATPATRNGCGDGETACLTDQELEAEVTHAMSVNGWTGGTAHVFFVFTPNHVGSCYDTFGDCTFTVFCAYHSAFTGSGGSLVVYANVPYAAYDPFACGSGENPNGPADDTINVVSHEHNESITDPDAQTGWFDNSGEEDGDLCALNFGSALGGSVNGGTAYNQVINGGHYWLQQEWSNASDGCVLNYTGSAPPSPAPVISSFNPKKGGWGASVTLTGQGFTGTTEVDFNGVASTSFSVDSDTQITATVPTGATSGQIEVVGPDGSATSSGSFTLAPGIASFSPGNGLTGSTAVISGNGFTGATRVSFGGAAATSFTVDSDIQISAVVPANAKTGPISVKTPAGTAVSSGNFAVLPALSGYSPASGFVGSRVTLAGTGLFGATEVDFNGVPATPSNVHTGSLKAKVPPTATSGTIRVVTPDGTATIGSFTVLARVKSFSPTNGGPGATVTISGSGFAGATGVQFNGVPAASFTLDSPTQITAVVPAGAGTGPVTVTTADGSAVSHSSFTYRV
jgi:hypothetical protein